MIPSFPIHTPISAFCNHNEVGIGQFRPCGHRYASARKPIKDVRVEIMRSLCRLTDPRDEKYLMRLEVAPDQGLFDCLQQWEVSTARKPSGFILSVILNLYHCFLLSQRMAHRPFLIAPGGSKCIPV